MQAAESIDACFQDQHSMQHFILHVAKVLILANFIYDISYFMVSNLSLLWICNLFFEKDIEQVGKMHLTINLN